ncbi:DUF3558 domain-containing protein [Streptomyces sp. NPDC091292]|uniref:DUF3558 domain-containing protein n=1 Tax=Streptomyces sp. NPDC091292 TaxID=3365991 RepID=UPI0037F44D90
MQRKAYVPGVVALLAALLAGCTGGSGGGDPATDAKPGDPSATVPAAAPGKYRTLPEPCGAVDHGTLDSLLPGIRQLTDEDQRAKAYEGAATTTYDTDRRVGCRWKVEAAGATHHLLVDFERVVSYDRAVSDDTRADEVYTVKQKAADLPEPAASTTGSGSTPGAKGGGKGGEGDPSSSGTPSGSTSAPGPSDSSDPGSGGPAAENLLPRVLGKLGDAAYLDDRVSTSASATRQRTVTVVFRTSNVIVTIAYDEQPTVPDVQPDSKELQDRAQKLAHRLAERFAG